MRLRLKNNNRLKLKPAKPNIGFSKTFIRNPLRFLRMNVVRKQKTERRKLNLMSQTKIYTTRKLEKVTKKFISENDKKENEYLGDWTATLFYVSHKKCWLIINKMTKYLLILPNVKKTDLKNISTIFKETFYSQLTYDGIITEYELVEKIIGGIELCETNNDRSVNGSLNNCLLYLDDWKYEFGDFENMPFRDLNNRLNSSPNKMLNWKYPKEKMDELIKAYAQHSI